MHPILDKVKTAEIFLPGKGSNRTVANTTTAIYFCDLSTRRGCNTWRLSDHRQNILEETDLNQQTSSREGLLSKAAVALLPQQAVSVGVEWSFLRSGAPSRALSPAPNGAPSTALSAKRRSIPFQFCSQFKFSSGEQTETSPMPRPPQSCSEHFLFSLMPRSTEKT